MISAVDFEIQLLNTLRASEGLKNIVGNKIFALHIPQGTKLPCVSFQRISGNPANTLLGYSGLEQIELQVDAWATTYAQAKSVAKAIREAIPTQGSLWAAHLRRDVDLYEEGTEYYRVMMNYTVWFLENASD